MVVCKFFQQGGCRFGQSCRFEHVYGSKYSYISNSAPHTTNQEAQTTITDEQLVQQVQSDIQSVLRGNQWVLSCYAPFKEKPNFPSLSDLSPEEARLFIYEAKASNTLEQAVSYINSLVQDARSKHEQLLLVPSPNMLKTFRSLYNGDSATCPFSSSLKKPLGMSHNAATSVFRSAVQSNSVFSQNAAPSVFNSQGNCNSVFGTQPTQNSAAKSIFAQANQNAFTNQPQTANSIFASASQQIFGQSNSPQQSTGFANATSPASIFQSQPQNQSAFTHNNQAGSMYQQNDANIFKQATESNFGPAEGLHASSIFAQASKGVFGQTQQAISDDPEVYSNMEELSQDDLEAFKSQDFQLGFIPEVPPPRMLCGL